jgi:uncharacterized repeat protein (TIGR02543 family)
MRGTPSSWALVLLAALSLGVGGAGARTLATTTLSVQVIGGGQVTSDGGQITCGSGAGTCYFTSSATSGSVELTANDTSGWTFDAWTGCAGATDNECTVALDGGDHDVTAGFTPGTSPGTSTLTVHVTGSGTDGGKITGGDIGCDAGETDCTSSVYTGSTLTLVEEPDDGYDFTGWGGACSGTTVSCTVTMSSSQTVNAAFAKSAATKKLTVTVAGNGTVTGSGIACTSAGGSQCSADETTDSTVTLTATPGSGAGFTGWGGACAGSATTCTLTMSSDQTVSATFTGSGGGVAPSTFALTVSVSGEGTVTGGGVSCGAGRSVCSENQPAGSAVTLTATPAEGGAFEGWGGACSGTSPTCSLTMSSARTVNATFSGGSSTGVPLTVSVAGRGTVSGGGIRCGNGANSCSASQTQGSSVGLTAVPAAGWSFAGWGGACTGEIPTCTVEMNTAKTVSARFASTTGSAGAGEGLRSRGRPVVTRTRTGFSVTLRFRTSRRATVRVRALRAGRLETAFSFAAAPGFAAVGPFPLAKAGFYAFELTQSGRALRWHACLGRCGEAAGRVAGPFTLERRAATVIDAGALWSVSIHFDSTQPAGVGLRIYRGKRLARDVRFASRSGRVSAGPFLLSPGNYTLRLRATDAFGRIRGLAWVAVLP